ncbi:hypothetical protein RND81_11G110600 [Saponaria officinalis]|uniref:Uncharacterized protein n=1 Tax=Saponaria officinalis TaxID=3572 RepID=A0AAW1HKM5_SAPOF
MLYYGDIIIATKQGKVGISEPLGVRIVMIYPIWVRFRCHPSIFPYCRGSHDIFYHIFHLSHPWRWRGLICDPLQRILIRRLIVRRCPPGILIIRVVWTLPAWIWISVPCSNTHMSGIPLIRVMVRLLPTSMPPCWRRLWLRPGSPGWISRRRKVVPILTCRGRYDAHSLVPPGIKGGKFLALGADSNREVSSGVKTAPMVPRVFRSA